MYCKRHLINIFVSRKWFTISHHFYTVSNITPTIVNNWSTSQKLYASFSLRNKYDTNLVESIQVCIEVISIIRVSRIELIGPFSRFGHVLCWTSFWFTFIIYKVKTHNLCWQWNNSITCCFNCWFSFNFQQTKRGTK